jgi:hypothetical protein
LNKSPNSLALAQPIINQVAKIDVGCDTIRKIKVTSESVELVKEFPYDLKINHKLYVSKLNDILLDFDGTHVEILRISSDSDTIPSHVKDF